jgi:gluconolactonase
MKEPGICLLLITGLWLSYPTAQALPPAQGAQQGPGGSPAPTPAPLERPVLRLDPALDTIISPEAKLEVLKDDYFNFTEGPAWMPEGFLVFSDIPENKIYRWDPTLGVSVFLEKAGLTTATPEEFRAHGGGQLLGSNGLAIDKQGRLLICSHGDRLLWRLEKDGTRTILADKFEGKPLNGPNDLTVKSDGSIYFSDRGSGLEGGQSSPLKLLPTAVMRWKDGKLDRLAVDGGANGIALSPDEKYLYVISLAAKKIDRYPVMPDGALGAREIGFIDMSQDKALGGPDGMEVDRSGNIFSVGPGGVWIVSPAGKLLGKILLPKNAANLAFGDADGKGLYITAGTSLYRIQLAAVASRD